MAKKDGSKMRPRLRFPEFRGKAEWKYSPLHLFTAPVTERAKAADESQVLTLSGEYGIVLQSEYFGKKVAGTNSERYLKIARNDFVYNDRTTKQAVYGTIKRLSKHDGGIVSPIYKCFRFDVRESPEFWEFYFDSGVHDLELKGLINEGARTGRFNISINQFLSTSACRPERAEQEKIADCLSSLDELITAQGRKVETLKAHKRGLMQELFPREGETMPRLRFPEFRDGLEWENKPLAVVAENLDNKRVPVTEQARDKGQIPYYGASGIVDYVKDYLFDEDLLCVSEDGANLVARTYPIAFAISGKTWVNNHAHVLRFSEPSTQKFVELYLNSIDLQDFITGMAQPKLNRAMLDSIPIPHPEHAEQAKIASCLSSLDTLIAAEAEKLEALKTHKKGLMQGLFPAVEKES